MRGVRRGGRSYPFGWSANTGYYHYDTMTVYMIVDAAGREYLVITTDYH